MPADEVIATLRQAWNILAELRVPAAVMGGLALELHPIDAGC